MTLHPTSNVRHLHRTSGTALCLLASTLMAAESAAGDGPHQPSVQMETACAPVHVALRHARRQPLVSQYRVDDGFWPVALQAMAFRVGDLMYETENGVLVLHQLEAGQDLLAGALEAELAAGRAWCRIEGEVDYHGMPAMRVSFRLPGLAEQHQPAAVLIDRADGLPRWHGYANMVGGFAWVYDRPVLVFPPPGGAAQR